MDFDELLSEVDVSTTDSDEEVTRAAIKLGAQFHEWPIMLETPLSKYVTAWRNARKRERERARLAAIETARRESAEREQEAARLAATADRDADDSDGAKVDAESKVDSAKVDATAPGDKPARQSRSASVPTTSTPSGGPGVVKGPRRHPVSPHLPTEPLFRVNAHVGDVPQSRVTWEHIDQRISYERDEISVRSQLNVKSQGLIGVLQAKRAEFPDATGLLTDSGVHVADLVKQPVG